jgi:hypothetical protein
MRCEHSLQYLHIDRPLTPGCSSQQRPKLAGSSAAVVSKGCRTTLNAQTWYVVGELQGAEFSVTTAMHAYATNAALARADRPARCVQLSQQQG